MTALAAMVFVLGAIPAGRAALFDARDHRLPDPLVAASAIVAILGLGIIASVNGETDRVVGMAAGAGLFTAWWLVTHLVSPALVGFGDVKYTAALGLYLGWFDPWLGLGATALACVLATPPSIWRLLRKDERSIPLGPYLFAATVILSAVQWTEIGV